MFRVLAACLVFTLWSVSAADEAYVAEILKWRQQEEKNLRSANGPLTLVGHFKLEEGVSTVGSDGSSTVLLPSRAPQHVGTITRQGSTFRFEASIPFEVNGKPAARTVELHVAAAPKPSDRVSFGDFTFGIRPIGEDYYALVSDAHSAFLEEFKGRTWFPVDPAYRVEAQFRPFETPKTVPVPFTFGSGKSYQSTGELVFQLAGQTLRLQPVVIGDELFVMFRDETSARETYGGGRYIEVPLPRDGKTTLDFNKAYNPYCAFNPFTGCPVPPRENRLPVRAAAGETYADKH